MEKSSFFNAELVGEEYDRTYLAEDYAQYFASFIGNGVFPNPSNNLQIIADGTSMNVVLRMGKAWINGYFYANTTDLVLSIAPADGVLNRIDRVVLRLDFLNREIKCYTKQGTFASNPVVPALQRDADMYEIGIADIKVNKGAIAITQANITDLRQDNNYSGIVHGTVEQVDVTTLFNQYSKALELKEQGFEEEFQSWFDSIKGQLSGDVAGNLQNQINTIDEQLGDMTQVPTISKTASGAITELYTDVESNTDIINSIKEHVKRESGTYTDKVTQLGAGGTYTKTIPLGFNAKSGFVVIDGIRGGGIVFFRDNSQSAVSWGLNERHYSVFPYWSRLADESLVGYLSSGTGGGIYLKNIYIENSNLIVIFSNDLSSGTATFDMRYFNWEVEG